MENTPHSIGNVVLFAVIFLLFRCDVQGTIHHLNTNQHQEIKQHFKTDREFFTSDHTDDIRKLSAHLRTLRQSGGSNPQASTVTLSGDTHQFAQTFYSGEDSKVNL